MQLIPHCCPECQFHNRAPILEIAEGSAGFWQCEACHRTYEIRLEFLRVSSSALEQAAEQIDAAGDAPCETDEVEAGDEMIARLREIQQQIQRLRGIIQQLEEEASRLEEDQ